MVTNFWSRWSNQMHFWLMQDEIHVRSLQGIRFILWLMPLQGVRNISGHSIVGFIPCLCNARYNSGHCLVRFQFRPLQGHKHFRSLLRLRYYIYMPLLLRVYFKRSTIALKIKLKSYQYDMIISILGKKISYRVIA